MKKGVSLISGGIPDLEYPVTRPVADGGAGGSARDGRFLGPSLTLGSILGTKVRIHWTFSILLAWIALRSLLSGGSAEALSGIAFVIALFACVLAHEFGHVLVARQFGIRAPDVTLLPIGGLARLERMPEQPGRELAVALAGPAVNVIIAVVLILTVGIQPLDHSHATNLRPADILPNVAYANLFLAAFNLIPAFPMDGGRALRALVTTMTNRARATDIAANIGQILAIGLGLLGLISGNPLLIFIALFVYFGAYAEAQDTRLLTQTHSLRAKDAMMHQLVPLSMHSRLDDAAELLLSTAQKELPILDGDGSLAGLLTRERLIGGLRTQGTRALVCEAMEREIPVIQPGAPLRSAIDLMKSHPLSMVAVVDPDRRFRGLITQENLGESVMVATSGGATRSAGVPLVTQSHRSASLQSGSSVA